MGKQREFNTCDQECEQIGSWVIKAFGCILASHAQILHCHLWGKFLTQQEVFGCIFGSHKTFCIAIGWESLAFPLHVLNSFSETFLSYQNLSPLMATQETWSTKSEIIYFPVPRLPFSDFGRFLSFPSRGTTYYWESIVYLKEKFTKMAAKVAKIRHFGFQEFRNRNMCFRKFDL